MSLWLDHKIFGNGFGLKSPYFDNKFYWLSGQLYTWIGGFGAQLQSIEWFNPRPYERRELLGRQFRPFNGSRQRLWINRDGFVPIPLPISKSCISWSMTSFPSDIDKANEVLRELKKELDNL